ncbi:MAG: hypothetical protein QOJ60_1739, partial [Actinomycetota bacterium]|nr:hypothetical protein [Actinomycetota bacterium]
MAEADRPGRGDAGTAPDVDRRIVSVLFADVVGFTPLSERLDPEDVATIQDAYFAAARDVMSRYGGVVEKFIGDAVMAVFGAPRARDDDAERAVRAGLALISAVERIGVRLGLEADELHLRVGVNTGEVVHASGGPDSGRVTGDTVNTAARLQAAAAPGAVLLGELTALTVAETIDTVALDPVVLKGKAEPVRVSQATGVRLQPSREAALGSLRAPTLGREVELRRLAEAMEESAAHSSAVRWLIVAPPGVGKTRLLDELASTADVLTLRARVRPHAGSPYDPVGQLFADLGGDVRAAMAATGTLDARAAVVAAEVARLGAPEQGDAVVGADLGTEREQRFAAWLEALDILSGGPSTWLVEDVHWAGRDLLAFLEYAGRTPSPTGRLVVTTARPGLLETELAWCEGAHRLDLPHLPPAAASDLVRALVGDALPDDLLDQVVEHSDGTPLFIEELLRAWANVGILEHDESGWQLTFRPDAVHLPPTVQAIYAAQLDDLPPDARLVARRGSVAGRRIPLGALSALHLLESRTGVDALRRRAFLGGPLDDNVVGVSFAYRHALLRDAGYASLARGERSRLHVAMAGWLAEVARDRVGLVAEAMAEHFALALESLPALGAPDLPTPIALAGEAASWYDVAADAALRLSAVDAAERCLRHAIELTATADERGRARRRMRLGEVLAASAELDVGIEELEAAKGVFESNPDAVTDYERTCYALARAYIQQIRFPEAAAVTAGALERLAGAVEPVRLARLHALHAWSMAANGVTAGVTEEADAALELVRAGDDREAEVDVLEHWCAAHDEVGDASDDGWALLEERASAIGRWPQVVVAARVRATGLAWREPRSALPELDRVGLVAEAMAEHFALALESLP